MRKLLCFGVLLLGAQGLCAQTDSSLEKIRSLSDSTSHLQQLAGIYVRNIRKKMDVYNQRMTGKTEKTLERLSKWEEKIHTVLNKTSPRTAQRLFGSGQETFSSLLSKLKEGQSITQGYAGRYNSYTDKVSTSLYYMERQEQDFDTTLVKPVAEVNDKIKTVSKEEETTEVVQQFIKKRKKQLMEGAFLYIKNSSYFTKINEESFYYTATLKNYKELFSDQDKIEQATLSALKGLPSFQKFAHQNSMLSSLFGTSGNNVTDNTSENAIAGLQTRTSLQNMLQQKIPLGGPNIDQLVTQNAQQSQGQMGDLKSKLNQTGGGSSSDLNMPEGFKPNMQKTKTLLQRLEYGFDVQFQRPNGLLPSTSDWGLTIGYKLSDKNVIGGGISYKLGWGSGLNNISLSSQGIGLRSFIDEKIKGSLWITGGYEQNYLSSFNKIAELKNAGAWQQSGLIGITQKYKLGKKNTNMQLLWDFLSYSQYPRTSPVKFRLGYTF